MKMSRVLVLVVSVAVGFATSPLTARVLSVGSAYAGQVVDQGTAGRQGAWPVSTTATGAATTTETLVLTSSTTVPATAMSGRKSIEIQNLGPNSIYCNLSTTAVASKARKIISGGTWAVDVSDAITVKCIADTAAQLTTAATITTEIR